MTEAWREVVGLAGHPADPYTVNDAISRDCADCGAPAGVRCVVEATSRLGRHYRRSPCLARLREDDE